MRLFLASEAKNPLSARKLEQYVGGFDGKSIAYIPTAANGEHGWESWRNGGSWEFIRSLPAKVNLIQLEEYRNDTVLKDIEGKDILWFAGGVPGYLMYWIKRCSIDKHIKDILNDGTLFVGSSAGAMIAGKSLDVASWGFTDNEEGSEKIDPLKLVDFDIFPHYQEEFLPKIKEHYNGEKLYLLKNGEEIIVEDGKIMVMGEERIIGK